MQTARTEVKNAQKLKQFLIKNNLFNRNYQPDKFDNFIYFSLNKLNKRQAKELEKKFSAKIINRKLEKTEKNLSVEELLRKKLTCKEFKLIPHSQERIGSIMVLEIPDGLKKKEKMIAQAFLKTNPSIKTVVRKSHAHRGTYRLRKVNILAGKKTKETLHHENGIRMLIDIEKTYFSSRLANERLRINKQIRNLEEVLVMFSGAGPYPLVLAKHSPAKSVQGIEINLLAHQLALNNIKINKLENKIRVFEGDVRVVLPKIKRKFDRILMPLPKTSEQFLPLALKKIKKGGIIHLYAFLGDKELSEEHKKIREICKQEKRQIRILRKVKCGQFSPAIARYCFDIRVL